MRKFGFSFSWRRAIGISAAKGRLSRRIGIPLTRGGRERKLGRMLGSLGIFALLLERSSGAAGRMDEPPLLGCIATLVKIAVVIAAIFVAAILYRNRDSFQHNSSPPAAPISSP